MYPFFVNFDYPLLSTELKDQMISAAFDNADKVEGYYSEYLGGDDGNFALLHKHLHRYPDILNLRHRFKIPCRVQFVMQKNQSVVDKHVDTPDNGRNTVIIFPLYPITGYARTNFYLSYKSTKPCVTCKWEEGKPVIFNTQKYHSVEHTGDLWRINFQICFNESFEKVTYLYRKGELIHGQLGATEEIRTPDSFVRSEVL